METGGSPFSTREAKSEARSVKRRAVLRAALSPAGAEGLRPRKRRIDQALRELIEAAMADGSIAPADPRSSPSRWQGRSTGLRGGICPAAN